jgi:hypothetical protein
MYFECMAGFRSEDSVHLPTRYFTLHSPPGSHCLPVPRHPYPNSYQELWYSLLKSYGPRKLTKGSDKLPALGSVAAMFAEKLDEKYFAGIWRKSMIEGLLWQGLELTEVEDRMLSWSWASINGIPGNPLVGRWEQLACVLDCYVELQGKSQFGAVKHGWIKMEASLIRVILVDSQQHPGDTRTDLPLRAKHLRLRTPRGIRAGSYGRFDFIGKKHAEAEALANGDDLLFALILAVSVRDASNRVMNYYSLLVTLVEGEEGKNMRRVGFLV